MYRLSQPYLWNEQAAFAKLEEIVWPLGPVCPYCRATDRIGAVGGKGTRAGLKVCCHCRRQFRATIGTAFEGSHVPLHKWFQACFLLTASNNAISAHRLHLRLEVTSKTAVSMRRRLEPAIDGSGYDEREAQRRLGTWTESFGRGQPRRGPVALSCRSLGGGNAAAPGVPGCADMLWTTVFPCSADQFPAVPSRQFLGFLEIAQALDCCEDDDRFDKVLMRLSRCRGESPPRSAVRPISEGAFGPVRRGQRSDDARYRISGVSGPGPSSTNQHLPMAF